LTSTIETEFHPKVLVLTPFAMQENTFYSNSHPLIKRQFGTWLFLYTAIVDSFPFGAPRTGYIMKQVFCFLLTFIQSFHSGIKKEPENSRMYTEMTLFNHPISTHTHPLLPATKNREEVFTFKCTGLYLLLYYTQFCMNFAYIFRKNSKNHSKVALKKHNGHLHMYYTHTKSCLRRTEKWKRKKAMRPYFQVENNHKFIIKR